MKPGPEGPASLVTDRDSKSGMVSKDFRDFKDFKDFRDFRDFKDFKDFKDFRDLRHYNEGGKPLRACLLVSWVVRVD